MDQISLCIRIVLPMLRQVKVNETQRNRIMRGLSNEESAKLNMVLKKVVLPAGYVEDQEKYEEAEECQAQQLDLQPEEAMVPYNEAEPETKTAEKQPQSQTTAKTVATAVSKSLTPFPKPLPSIFSKILNKPTEPSQQAEPCKPRSASKTNQKLQDEDLLQEVMSHVPQEPTRTAKKQPSKGFDKKKNKKNTDKKKTKKNTNHTKEGKASKQSKDANAANDKKQEVTKNPNPVADVPMYHVQGYPCEADTATYM